MIPILVVAPSLKFRYPFSMPQLQLPIFLEGVNPITPELGYLLEGSQVTYLHGMLPVFTHEETDTASFKMITSQFYVSGTAKQAQIVQAFGINPLALKRWVKKYRAKGKKKALGS